MYKLFLIALLLPLSLFAQDTIPQKGASKITITNDLSAAENFKLVGMSLLDNDYVIDKKDSDLLFYTTGLKPTPKINGSYLLNIRVKDNKIILTGKCKLGRFNGVISSDDLSDIENRGMNGSLLKVSFNEMNAFAGKIKGERSYE